MTQHSTPLGINNYKSDQNEDIQDFLGGKVCYYDNFLSVSLNIKNTIEK